MGLVHVDLSLAKRGETQNGAEGRVQAGKVPIAVSHVEAHVKQSRGSIAMEVRAKKFVGNVERGDKMKGIDMRVFSDPEQRHANERMQGGRGLAEQGCKQGEAKRCQAGRKASGLRNLGFKRAFALRFFALCFWVLGATLGACSPSEIHNPMDTGVAEGGARGYTVSFERNCTNSVEEFARKNVKPPAKTVEDFPQNPTCPGHRFVEWNTAIDGSGTPFTAQTPLPAGEILVIVYAKWEKLPPEPILPALHVELGTGTLLFSPIIDRTTTFSVAVSGFENEADAEDVRLEIGDLDKPMWLSVGLEGSDFSDGTKTFEIQVGYGGSAFAESASTIRMNLRNIPEGYAYGGGAQIVQVVVLGGQTRDRAIPVDQANIGAFNAYAITANGLGRHYQLVQDVVLSSNWTPIGRYLLNSSTPLSEAFTGSFDGGGHTISGLVINNPNSDDQGFFGTVSGANAVIENLGLIGVNIRGKDLVGALAGYSGGMVRNCYATGSVEGVSSEYAVGGLIGGNGGTVQNSYSTVSVRSNSGDRVGGLVGSNSGTVEKSYARGSVIGGSTSGGLVGLNFGTVRNSYATGSVEATWGLVGGLVGSNNGGTVEKSYATGGVIGANSVGGLAGVNSNTGIFSSVTVHGTLRNCVALNLSVRASDDSGNSSIGRVAGSNTSGSSLSGNYGRSNMNLTYGTSITYSPGSGLTVKDGQSASAYGTQNFWTGSWTGTNAWDFNEVWQWGPNNLPILRNVGGEQNHTLQ